MTDDSWNQDNAWAEPQAEGDVSDETWMEDIRTGQAHYMQGYPAPSSAQSGLGIASLLLSILAGLLVIGTLTATMIMVANNPVVDETDPKVMAVGCGIILGMLLAAVAGLLGLIGVFQPDRSKTCAIIGLILSGLEVCGVGGLVLIGLLLG